MGIGLARSKRSFDDRLKFTLCANIWEVFDDGTVVTRTGSSPIGHLVGWKRATRDGGRIDRRSERE
jgi:hypothetical protein